MYRAPTPDLVPNKREFSRGLVNRAPPPVLAPGTIAEKLSLNGKVTVITGISTSFYRSRYMT